MSTDRATYELLKELALSTGLCMSEVLRQIVDFAKDKIGVVDE